MIIAMQGKSNRSEEIFLIFTWVYQKKNFSEKVEGRFCHTHDFTLDIGLAVKQLMMGFQQ